MMGDFCSLLLGLLMIINGVGMVRLDREGFRDDLDSFFTLKYFDSTIYNEPYFALRNWIARSVTSKLQF